MGLPKNITASFSLSNISKILSILEYFRILFDDNSTLGYFIIFIIIIMFTIYTYLLNKIMKVKVW